MRMTHVELICCSNSKRSVYFDLRHKHIYAGLSLLFGLMLFCFLIGSHLGVQNYTKDFLAGSISSLEQQQEAINKTQNEAQSRLNLLSRKLAGLQTQMMRLNALADTLASHTEVADLSFSEQRLEPEFNLRSEPSIQSNTSDFLYELELLAMAIQDRKEKLMAMESILLEKNTSTERFPSIMPVKAYVSSWFGPRKDPLSAARQKSLFHEGIDFSADIGSNVVSTAAGIVTWAGPLDNYGNVVEINHGNGYITRYAHNHEHFVKVGEKVNKGQLIASVGNSGRSTGPHLHYEVIKDGKHIDPKQFMILN